MAKRTSAESVLEKYVFDLMPDDVKEARERALYNLHYGAQEPDEDIGTTWAENSKIVDRWWDDNMGDSFVVDDFGNVSTQYEFDKGLEGLAKERYKEAYDEYVAEHTEEADENEDIDLDRDAQAYAEREAQYDADNANEGAMLFDSRDVKALILTGDWP